MQNQHINPINQDEGIRQLAVVGDFPRSTMELIRVRLIEVHGAPMIDVRAFYEDEAGRWKPSRKGLCFRPERLASLQRLLQEAEQVIEDALGPVDLPHPARRKRRRRLRLR